MKQKRWVMMLITIMMLGVTACGKEEKEKKEPSVSQEESQTTNVISGSAIGTVDSQDMKVEKYLPVICQEKEKDIEKKMTSGKYTWEEPCVMVNPYGNSPLTAYVIFDTEIACGVKVTVKGKTENTDISGEISEVTKHHRVPIIGLYPGMKNEVELRCTDKNGKAFQMKKLDIVTKKLTSKLKNAVRVEKGGKEGAYDLTMISGQTTKYPFAYDKAGDIRWYVTMTTGSYGVFPLSNQRLILQSDEALTPTEEKPHTTQMYELDYLGRAYRIYYVKNGVHHEVIEKTPGGNLMVLSNSINGRVEDVVQEIHRDTGEVVSSLDMREIFDDTYQNKADWAHLNTVSYNAKDDTVLLSPRNLHAGVKVGWSDKEIKWILANPKMFQGTKQEKYVLKPVGDITWHFQPHSIYEMPEDMDGNSHTRHIMMYDNHWQTKRKVKFFDKKKESNVSVYVVDEKNKTVTQEKLFSGVRSIITSNCAYDQEKKRMFSFGGYLHPLVDGQKGMNYEFDYITGEVVSQYSTKEYFYRGYEMKIDWEDLTQPLKIGNDYVVGALQAPIEETGATMPTDVLEDEKIAFKIKESVLYMSTSDHAISKIRFVGQKTSYIMDYSSAGKGMKSKGVQEYDIAIPLGGLQPDTYQVAVNYKGKWLDAEKEIIRKGE